MNTDWHIKYLHNVTISPKMVKYWTREAKTAFMRLKNLTDRDEFIKHYL